MGNNLKRSYTPGGNVNRYNHFGKIIWQIPKHLKINLQNNSAMLLLGIYPRESMYSHKNMYRMFTAGLCTKLEKHAFVH